MSDYIIIKKNKKNKLQAGLGHAGTGTVGSVSGEICFLIHGKCFMKALFKKRVKTDTQIKRDVVEHGFNSSTQDTEADESLLEFCLVYVVVPGQPSLHSETVSKKSIKKGGRVKIRL